MQQCSEYSDSACVCVCVFIQRPREFPRTSLFFCPRKLKVTVCICVSCTVYKSVYVSACVFLRDSHGLVETAQNTPAPNSSPHLFFSVLYSVQGCSHTNTHTHQQFTHQCVLVSFDEVMEGCCNLLSRLCFLKIPVHSPVFLLQRRGEKKRTKYHIIG